MPYRTPPYALSREKIMRIIAQERRQRYSCLSDRDEALTAAIMAAYREEREES